MNDTLCTLHLKNKFDPISFLFFFNRNRNWEVVVSFKVAGKGKDLFGDGFAIWYAKDRMISGPVFGSKDLFSGLAIIIDTYSNHNGPHNHAHPYISGE